MGSLRLDALDPGVDGIHVRGWARRPVCSYCAAAGHTSASVHPVAVQPRLTHITSHHVTSRHRLLLHAAQAARPRESPWQRAMADGGAVPGLRRCWCEGVRKDGLPDCRGGWYGIAVKEIELKSVIPEIRAQGHPGGDVGAAVAED